MNHTRWDAISVPLKNRLIEQADGTFALPEDGWYQVAPIGEFPHGESGLVQVLDRAAIEAMANSFVPGTELLIDFEHESHDDKKRTEAAGWIKNVEARDDGLWMQVRWSKLGADAVRGGVYRYISPVWLNRDCEQLPGNKIRPKRLNDAGLTNSPNLKGMAPLANREGNDPADQTKPKKTKTMDYKQMLLQMLGLPPEATDEQITAALGGATTNMQKGREYPTLENRYKALLADQVEADLNTAGLQGTEREAWKGQLLANREGTLPLLATVIAGRGNQQAAALTNRSKAQAPNGGKDPGAAAVSETQEKDQATQQREAIQAVKNANRGISNEAAYQQAKAANPALFLNRAAE